MGRKSNKEPKMDFFTYLKDQHERDGGYGKYGTNPCQHLDKLCGGGRLTCWSCGYSELWTRNGYSFLYDKKISK